MATLAAVLLLVLGGAVLRFWPVPAVQRQALAALQAPAPVQGPDGSALLWSLGYDGADEAGRERLLAGAVARWEQQPPGSRDGVFAVGPPLVHLAMPAGSRCASRGEGCLAQVRADPGRFAAAHQGHEALHARVARLADHGAFLQPFSTGPGDVTTALPELLPLLDPPAAHALAFVHGDTPAALQGACQGILAGRRLVHGSDMLVVSMVGAAMVETNAHLLAEMLVELPAALALPAACQAALQPMAVDEQDICPAMRGEFAQVSAALDVPGVQLRWGWPVFDGPRTRLRRAPYYAWACGAPARRALAEDQPLPVPAAPRRGLACLANAQGCTLADMGSAALQPYAARSQDAAAMLRLVATQRWLRQQPGAPAQALAALPAALRSSTRVPVVSADGQRLEVARRSPAVLDRAGPVLSVPLVPASGPR
ncbi:hypothetical protein [Stenotrophomonas sp. 24(2023)]|uniref:hypothetical protein n=1 Tax=Stenotrophomonas sp. 24(2023) TaxID=3068324 RepID=UPI0027E0CE09|nr:hypothetical protein [Stenotrophomonas sp. 24(2023)]WMJ70037.1 hypothetical protein Q9R17_02715 [Stenotrophomonas sp. 24(2023)]